MANFNSFKDKLLAGIGQAFDAGKDFAEKAVDATKDVAEKAADKAKAGSRIAKLNIEIAGEKENMKKTYIEIGKLYYDTHKDDPEGFFIQLCEEIALAEKNIADKEAEIAELKAKDDDDSIEVEFEEIVAEEEAAAEECGCCCGCEEKAEDKAEEVIEKVEDAVEEVVEKIEDAIEE